MKKKYYKVSRRKDIVLKLIEEKAGYTIADLAKMIFGEVTWFSKSQVGQVLSSLRKDGIPAYPRKKDGEVIIPQTVEDYRDILRYIFNGGLPTRMLRAVNLLIESAMRYPQLTGENMDKLKTLEQPIANGKKGLKELTI